jgi:hypothetical protein
LDPPTTTWSGLDTCEQIVGKRCQLRISQCIRSQAAGVKQLMLVVC